MNNGRQLHSQRLRRSTLRIKAFKREVAIKMFRSALCLIFHFWIESKSATSERGRLGLEAESFPFYNIFMIDWFQCSAAEVVPTKMSGAWVFNGTRLPISSLFENLASGATVQDFVEWYPGVEKEDVIAVLKFAAENSRYPKNLSVLRTAV
jgi:uncharacterized protein (DUF433 family)